MTLEDKLRELEAIRDRYIAAINAMTAAAAKGEKSEDAWDSLITELNAAESAFNDAIKRHGTT